MFHRAWNIFQSFLGFKIRFRRTATPFRFRELPPELRLKIYPYAFALDYDGQAPALLLAIASDPVLYAEAKSIVCQINARITLENQAVFKKMHLKRLLQYKHLMLCNVPLSFVAGQKLALMNNFRTITIDLLNYSQELLFVQHLIQASRTVTTLRVRIKKPRTEKAVSAKHPAHNPFEVWAVHTISNGLGVKARLEKVTTAESCRGNSWLWTRDDGGLLKFAKDWEKSWNGVNLWNT